jgi:hypothetical protein
LPSLNNFGPTKNLKENFMKNTILALLFGFTLSTFGFANEVNVLRCQSDCWLDQGDLSGVGRKCFSFYVSTDGEGNYQAKMIGGYDDEGNSNAYDIGPVLKSVGANGETNWKPQTKSYVRSIQFSSMTPNTSCRITDSNNRVYEGTSLSLR